MGGAGSLSHCLEEIYLPIRTIIFDFIWVQSKL